FCESRENAVAAIDVQGTVRPLHSTTLSVFFPSRAGDGSQVRRREWPQASSPGQHPAEPSLNQDFRAFRFESKTDFGQTFLAHGMTKPGFIFGIEHQKPAAACADQLSAKCAVCHRAIVKLVDMLIAHLRRTLFFLLPMNIH